MAALCSLAVRDSFRTSICCLLSENWFVRVSSFVCKASNSVSLRDSSCFTWPIWKRKKRWPKEKIIYTFLTKRTINSHNYQQTVWCSKPIPQNCEAFSYPEWKASKNLCHEQKIQGKRGGSNSINFSREILFNRVSLFLVMFQRTDQNHLFSRDKFLMKMKQNCNEKVPLPCNIRKDEIPTGLSQKHDVCFEVSNQRVSIHLSIYQSSLMLTEYVQTPLLFPPFTKSAFQSSKKYLLIYGSFLKQMQIYIKTTWKLFVELHFVERNFLDLI